MARPSVLGLCAAVAAGGAAWTAFVAPPALGSGSPSLRRGAVTLEALGEADGLAYEASFAASPEQPQQPQQPQALSLPKWLSAGVLAGLMMAVASAPAEALDGRPTLTPEKWAIKQAKRLQLCKDNKKYHKRIKDEIFKLTRRQNKYPKGSVVWNRMEDQVNLVKRREVAYGDRYCGKVDGLPRVIATGENVRGGVVVPALIFLYTAGWIGWAGRSYLIRTQDEMKELNIDVPLALTCMASGFSWPVAAWQEIVNGDMVVPQSEVYISGRAAP